ncbi:MAG: hypothetical protein P1V51_08750 [Deltaproteobacteria bacterium]|nr:hypothetical protein [Deltaproteobacteria bacterium]
MARYAGQMEIALTRAGHVAVAVPADRVAGVRRGEGDDDEVPRLSLASCLGLAAPGARPASRFLQVMTEGGAYELGVDGKVEIRRVELASLHRLPELVSDLGPRIGISGLLELDDGLVFFIDLDVMTRWALRDREVRGES